MSKQKSPDTPIQEDSFYTKIAKDAKGENVSLRLIVG